MTAAPVHTQNAHVATTNASVATSTPVGFSLVLARFTRTMEMPRSARAITNNAPFSATPSRKIAA